MPDVKPAALVRSVTEAMRHVKRGENVRAEGVGGKLSAFRDVEPYLWCVYFGRVTPLGANLESVELLRSTAAVHDWLREWFPRLHGKDPRGDHSRYRGGRMGREDRRRLSAPPTRTRCRRK